MRRVPFRRVGNRVISFMGVDRELGMFMGLLAGILIFEGMTRFTLIEGLVYWFGSIWLLRLMWKADPMMRRVYMRAIMYRGFYPARSTHWRVDTLRALFYRQPRSLSRRASVGKVG